MPVFPTKIHIRDIVFNIEILSRHFNTLQVSNRYVFERGMMKHEKSGETLLHTVLSSGRQGRHVDLGAVQCKLLNMLSIGPEQS